jgi:hypothetical protein
VDVRGDRRVVRIYHRGDLIKVHVPQLPGRRATDYADCPAARAPYAMRAPDACIRQAEGLGPAIGQFTTVLLSGTFPWARLRQAQKLLRLAERYGAARVNAACARAGPSSSSTSAGSRGSCAPPSSARRAPPSAARYDHCPPGLPGRRRVGRGSPWPRAGHGRRATLAPIYGQRRRRTAGCYVRC